MADENPDTPKTPGDQRRTILGLMGFIALQAIAWGPYLNSIRESNRTIGEGDALRSTVEKCRLFYPQDAAPGSLIWSRKDDSSNGWFFAIGRASADAPLVRVWVDRHGVLNIQHTEYRIPWDRRPPAYTLTGVDPPNWEAIPAGQSPKQGKTP